MTDSNEERIRLERWLNRFGRRFEIGFFVLNPTNAYKINFVNEAFTKATGIGKEEIGRQVLELLNKEESDLLIKGMGEKFTKGHSTKIEMSRRNGKGDPVWIEVVLQPILNDDGELISIAGFVFDVSARKIDELILKLQESILLGLHEGKALNQILQKIQETVCTLIPDASIGAYLKKEKNLWRIEKSPSLSSDLIKELENDMCFDTEALQSGKLVVNKLTPSENHSFIESWNMPIVNIDGEVSNVFSVYLKEQNKLRRTSAQYLKKIGPIIQMAITFFNQQDRLRSLAYSDPTTGLPNHHSIIRKINEKIIEGDHFFLAFIQPAEFTTVINLYGRHAIDNLIIQLTKRIKRLKGEEQKFIGKTSGEAIVLIDTVEKETDIESYARQLQAITAEPFMIAGTEMYITLKIGIAQSKGNNHQAEELVRRADAALTTSKVQVGFKVSFYKDIRNKQEIREMIMTNELLKALTTQEIEVYLQPKVELETGKINGFEALARWHTEKLGFVPPDEFILLAEKNGSIVELENQVLGKVLNWLAKRVNDNKEIYQVAVNISVDHFFDPSFIPTIKELIAQYSVAPKYLKLEITESIGLVDFKSAQEIFNNLHKLGVEMSIDDFGIGYSSLSYLPKLMVNELKIDRSFINGIKDQETHAVITTIQQLATNLKLSTVAEGIEEAYQVKALLEIGYKIGQGYYFYKPMPLSEVNHLLDQVHKE